MKFDAFVLLLASFLTSSALADHGSRIDHWGPYHCLSCKLRTPIPDAGTTAFIRAMEKFNYPGIGFLWKAAGDIFTICNSRHCVDYKRNDDGNFKGGPLEPIRSSSGGPPDRAPMLPTLPERPRPSPMPWERCWFGTATILVPPGGCDF